MSRFIALGLVIWFSLGTAAKAEGPVVDEAVRRAMGPFADEVCENLELLDGAGAGLLLEAVLTFALVFVVFATAIDKKGLKHLAPMAYGLIVLVDHLVALPLTGASMNPARSFGPAIVANIWTDHWIYWLGPLIGAGVAALVYEFVFLHREDGGDGWCPGRQGHAHRRREQDRASGRHRR